MPDQSRGRTCAPDDFDCRPRGRLVPDVPPSGDPLAIVRRHSDTTAGKSRSPPSEGLRVLGRFA